MAYATLQQVRDEGLSASEASDARVNSLLAEASAYIEHVTGQWFELRTLTLDLAGTGTKYLWLPTMATTVTSIKHVDRGNGTLTTIPASSWHLFDRRVPDDRRNPKVELLEDVFVPPGGLSRWHPKSMYRVAGTFGFVEYDFGGTSWTGGTPLDIRRACLLLVLHWSGQLGDPDAGLDRRASDLRRLSVQGRSAAFVGPTSTTTLSGNVEVDRLLARYRSPIEVMAA